ncbi:hypothetical protein Taro_007506 [Colocasia esculenta]|uniref:Uncharacterized protein n=1 Tax=Colocasia esculenta TaxID=4460 RepID=A0A843TZ51_COLES|nr:hypothetical protein [Colocasia esculenta]
MARHDISRGVVPVGRDLIVTRLTVAIRVAVAMHFPVAIGFAVATPCPIAIWLVSRRPSPQQFGVVLLCYPACSPGARHLRACPRSERLLQFPGTPILRSLLREVSGLRAYSSRQPSLGHRGRLEFYLVQASQSLVSLPLSALVPEPRSGVRREAATRTGDGVACVVCFCGGSVSPLQASKACGLWVPLLAASGGGLVVVVVTIPVLLVVPARFPISTVAPFLGVSPQWHRRVWLPDLVVYPGSVVRDLGGCPEGCFRSMPDFVARGSSSRELGVGRVAEAAVAPCVVSSSESECCGLLYQSELRVVFCKSSGSVGGDANIGVLGGAPGGRVVTVCGSHAWFVCMLQRVATVAVPRAWRVWLLGVHAVVAQLVVDSLAVVLLYGGRLQASPGAVLLVIFDVLCAELHRGLSAATLACGCVGLVLTGCELGCIAWLPCVLVRFPRTVAVVLVRVSLRTNGALEVLVEMVV